MSHEAAGLARAIRDHTLHAHKALTPRVRLGVVRQVSPLVVELIDADVLIDADELLLGSWLRLYDRVYGIVVGDNLFVYQLESGDWLAFDAASSLDLSDGVVGWRDGSGVPSNDLGKDADYYLDTATKILYEREAGSYTPAANLAATGTLVASTANHVMPATAALTDLFTFVVPGGTLAPNKFLRITCSAFAQSPTPTDTLWLFVAFGGYSFQTFAQVAATSGYDSSINMPVFLVLDNNNTGQVLLDAVLGALLPESAAINTTVDQTLKIRGRWNGGSPAPDAAALAALKYVAVELVG